ncbi:hypothetical protein Y032_0206g1955 [Ancylostoma ceylanicum]|uniref:Uncharacterized protein n=1 Tax=Ancylostoma ceylanicum TaxID=53326 RepID=A0A016SL39_9BILA|nr:hypothetical protein Y032_0206g1955 [Ancylostoma ceylanicum]
MYDQQGSALLGDIQNTYGLVAHTGRLTRLCPQLRLHLFPAIGELLKEMDAACQNRRNDTKFTSQHNEAGLEIKRT